MECQLHSDSLRIFVCAIQCVAKIGKEAFIEANSDGITLRALNDSKQAFFACLLRREFFTSYTLLGRSIRCKLPIKSAQGALRSTRGVETMHMQFAVDGVTHVLRMRLTCKNGLVKTHKLLYEECEMYQVVFDHTTARHHIGVRPAKLLGLLSHIHGADEITLALDPAVASLQSFHHSRDEDIIRSVLQTETRAPAAEFLEYRVACPEQVTFCLREFKAFLDFCNAPGVGQDVVGLHLSSGGDPLMLRTEETGACTFHAWVIMATAPIPSEDSSVAASSQQQEATDLAYRSETPVRGQSRKRHAAAAGIGDWGGAGARDEDEEHGDDE